LLYDSFIIARFYSYCQTVISKSPQFGKLIIGFRGNIKSAEVYPLFINRIAFRDIHRFGELRRHIGDITESSLTKQLRELEADGFITRYDYKEVPPRVEYNLTDLGKSFIPVFEHMKQWGDENLSE